MKAYVDNGTYKVERTVRRYYCEVEYLESTGTQYIDTGVIPSSKKISAEVKFKLNSIVNNLTNGIPLPI